jgi:tetratricopeptide (TPR) repeat protein
VFVLFAFFSASLQARENSTELYKQGAELAKAGRIDEAIPIFKKVIEISPYYCLGHYGLGKSYLYKEGKLPDAIKYLRLAVEYDKKFAKGYFYLGLAYLLSDKKVYALHAFKQAYEIDDTFYESLYNISIIYEKMGNSYESSIYFNRYRREKTKIEDDSIF